MVKYKVFKVDGWNKYAIRKRIFMFWWKEVKIVTGRGLAGIECANFNTIDRLT